MLSILYLRDTLFPSRALKGPVVFHPAWPSPSPPTAPLLFPAQAELLLCAAHSLASSLPTLPLMRKAAVFTIANTSWLSFQEMSVASLRSAQKLFF